MDTSSLRSSRSLIWHRRTVSIYEKTRNVLVFINEPCYWIEIENDKSTSEFDLFVLYSYISWV